jgi:hypothetical protein
VRQLAAIVAMVLAVGVVGGCGSDDNVIKSTSDNERTDAADLRIIDSSADSLANTERRYDRVSKRCENAAGETNVRCQAKLSAVYDSQVQPVVRTLRNLADHVGSECRRAILVAIEGGRDVPFTVEAGPRQILGRVAKVCEQEAKQAP